MKLFGYEIQKINDKARFREDDRLAVFVLMAFTERVNVLFGKQGFTIRITKEDRERYLKDGKVPTHLALKGQQFKKYFLKQIHTILWSDEDKRPCPNFHQMPALDADYMGELQLRIQDWKTTPQGLPFYNLFDYVPSKNKVTNEEINQRNVNNRLMAWNFKYNSEHVSPRKHVKALYDAAFPIAEHLTFTFGELADRLTLCCVPASSEDSQWLRYREFSELLCKKTGMGNSFRHVHIRSEKTPKHLGGEEVVNFTLDNDYFYGKAVILFDDILTTGNSLYRCQQILEKCGAKVVGAYVLGKTRKK